MSAEQNVITTPKNIKGMRPFLKGSVAFFILTPIFIAGLLLLVFTQTAASTTTMAFGSIFIGLGGLLFIWSAYKFCQYLSDPAPENVYKEEKHGLSNISLGFTFSGFLLVASIITAVVVAVNGHVFSSSLLLPIFASIAALTFVSLVVAVALIVKAQSEVETRYQDGADSHKPLTPINNLNVGPTDDRPYAPLNNSNAESSITQNPPANSPAPTQNSGNPGMNPSAMFGSSSARGTANLSNHSSAATRVSSNSVSGNSESPAQNSSAISQNSPLPRQN
jgi:hypothetical protein